MLYVKKIRRKKRDGGFKSANSRDGDVVRWRDETHTRERTTELENGREEEKKGAMRKTEKKEK